jgi:membrane associated rhomboid family serine protease
MQRSGYRAIGYPTYRLPTGVKWLLIVNVAVFLVDFFAQAWFQARPFELLQLIPILALHGFVWQFVTYMFLHGSVMHLLLNMLFLWFLGMDLERDWGTARFLRYYFLCGIGAGVCVVLVSLLRPIEMRMPTLGASGAILGLVLAYGVLYPDRIILFMLIFPMKAKYFAMICGAIAFLGSWQPGSGVSHVAHLGGMLVGYIYLKTRLKSNLFDPVATVRRGYRDWKHRRARRKFEVYLRKRDSGGGPWVN